MKKNIKQWIKQEKRLIKLLYQKGILAEHRLKLDDLYWAEYRRGKMGRKRKNSKYKYKFTEYYPEVHYCTRDYWGEYDEHGVVNTVLEGYFWANATIDYDENDISYPVSTWKHRSRIALMKYLQTLPTKYSKSKINRVLKINKD